MRKHLQSTVLTCLAVLLTSSAIRAEDEVTYNRTRDVIYGRKDGLALTMDVIAPKEKPNGLGVIFVVSGGWRRIAGSIRPEM